MECATKINEAASQDDGLLTMDALAGIIEQQFKHNVKDTERLHKMQARMVSISYRDAIQHKSVWINCSDTDIRDAIDFQL